MTFPNTQGSAGDPGPAQLPTQLAPMLAVAGALPRDDEGWAFEMKWDGVRAFAYLDGRQLRLASRTGRDITIAYPELAALGSAADSPLLLDGEVVAFEDGPPSFAQLQQRMHVTSAAQAARLSSRLDPAARHSPAQHCRPPGQGRARSKSSRKVVSIPALGEASNY